MRLLGRGFLLLALFAGLAGAAVAEPETGDLRKARAYLREVKKHLLESYIDRRPRQGGGSLVAGITAMAAAAKRGAIRTPSWRARASKARSRPRRPRIPSST